MRQTIVLVACCGSKLAGCHPAEDIYRSTLFLKAKAYALAHGDAWFILSAKYGLLAPGEVIESYDVTLNDASKEYRRDWAAKVGAQLAGHSGDRLVVLAGENYCWGWIDRFPLAERPMKGLGIGQQLSWLSKH